MIKILILTIILFPLSLFPQNVTPQEKYTFAISDLDAKGITKDESEILTSKLRSEFINLGFIVLERAKMDEILKEQGVQQTGVCSDASCAIEMGQLLGVTHVIVGSIGKIGGSYTVDARLISIKTGAIVRAVSQTSKGSIEDLLEKEMPSVAKQLAGFKEDKKSRTWLYVSIGAVGLGGAGLAYYLLSGNDKETSKKTSADVTVRW